MKNLISTGSRIQWTNGTGSGVASGDIVVVGALVCVACVDIADGSSGELATSGVFEVPKTAGSSGHAIGQGEAVMYDASAAKIDNKDASPATGDVTLFAVAFEAAITTATTVKIILNANPGTLH